MKKKLRKLLSYVLYFFRFRAVQNLIMWPVAKRFLGLDYEEIVNINNDLKLKVRLSYLDMVNRILCFYSDFISCAWEPKTARLFEKILDTEIKGDIVIAGAHIGYYVILAAKKSNQYVHGFEPVEEIYRDCLMNVKLNNLTNSVILNKIALSNFSGTAKMSIKDGNSTLLKIKEGTEVKTIKLDEYYEKKDSLPGIILLDVEGLEQEVLLGADKILKKSNCDIIFEINFKSLYRANRSISAVPELLHSYGYEIFVIEDNYFHANPIKMRKKSFQLIPFSIEYCKTLNYEFVNCYARSKTKFLIPLPFVRGGQR